MESTSGDLLCICLTSQADDSGNTETFSTSHFSFSFPSYIRDAFHSFYDTFHIFRRSTTTQDIPQSPPGFLGAQANTHVYSHEEQIFNPFKFTFRGESFPDTSVHPLNLKMQSDSDSGSPVHPVSSVTNIELSATDPLHRIILSI